MSGLNRESANKENFEVSGSRKLIRISLHTFFVNPPELCLCYLSMLEPEFQYFDSSLVLIVRQFVQLRVPQVLD